MMECRHLLCKCYTTILMQLKQNSIMSSSGSPKHLIEAYADGSYRNQKAGIGVYFPGNASFPEQELSECVQHNKITNQVAELSACIRAIEVAKEKKVQNLLLHTDSAYIVNSMTKWIHRWKNNNWKKSSSSSEIENIDLMQRLDELCQQVNVEWKFIPRKENKKANSLAQKSTTL